MKKITILGALALGVGVLVMAVWMASSSGEVQAEDTVKICHYDGGKVTQNKVHEQHSWSIVEVSNHGNAVAKHLANHAEPGGESDATGVSVEDCAILNGELDPLEADGPPGHED